MLCCKLLAVFCASFVLFTLFTGIITLSFILKQSSTLLNIFHDRYMFLENQFQLYDDWAKQPLRQKHKFYLFNITNGDRFLRSDTPMTVNEIGPFVYDSLNSNQTVGPGGYNLSYLSLEDLRFNLSESDGDESVFIYALNVPLIRHLSSEPHSLLKPPDEDLVRKTTVRDVLREIIDGYGLRTSQVQQFPVNEVAGELHKDASWNYLQFLRNEICLRLFRVVRFVNPPTTAKSRRFFRKLPCDCMVIAPNGTEDDPEYVRTSNYLVFWNDEHCSGVSGNLSLSIRRDRYVSENLFSVSSAAYWRSEGYVRYHPKTENLSETRIKVEQFSDVITDFSFEYQLNIPIKFRDEQVNNYPVLRTVTSGVSNEDVDSSIYRFIVYPRKGTETYAYNVKFCVSCFSITFLYFLFVWAWREIRTRMNAQLTGH